ncbi:MAG: P-TEFb-associated cyclin-dependent protein kinase Cdk9 [Paramarteilia canceri]
MVKDELALDLNNQLLILDPQQRIDADTALNHDFFFTDPMPCNLDSMMSQCKSNHFEYSLSKQINNQADHQDVNRGAVYDRIF